jgi:hypothetical protein
MRGNRFYYPDHHQLCRAVVPAACSGPGILSKIKYNFVLVYSDFSQLERMDSPAESCQIIFLKCLIEINWLSHFMRICILLVPKKSYMYPMTPIY